MCKGCECVIETLILQTHGMVWHLSGSINNPFLWPWARWVRKMTRLWRGVSSLAGSLRATQCRDERRMWTHTTKSYSFWSALMMKTHSLVVTNQCVHKHANKQINLLSNKTMTFILLPGLDFFILFLFILFFSQFVFFCNFKRFLVLRIKNTFWYQYTKNGSLKVL